MEIISRKGICIREIGERATKKGLRDVVLVDKFYTHTGFWRTAASSKDHDESIKTITEDAST